MTGEESSGDTIEIVIDLCASPSSETRLDSRAQEARVHTQDRDRGNPLKRRVEVSVRNLTSSDRDAFTEAKRKELASWLDKEAVQLVKDRLKVPRSHILRARWVFDDLEKRWN